MRSLRALVFSFLVSTMTSLMLSSDSSAPSGCVQQRADGTSCYASALKMCATQRYAGDRAVTKSGAKCADWWAQGGQYAENEYFVNRVDKCINVDVNTKMRSIPYCITEGTKVEEDCFDECLPGNWSANPTDAVQLHTTATVQQMHSTPATPGPDTDGVSQPNQGVKAQGVGASRPHTTHAQTSLLVIVIPCLIGALLIIGLLGVVVYLTRSTKGRNKRKMDNKPTTMLKSKTPPVAKTSKQADVKEDEESISQLSRDPGVPVIGENPIDDTLYDVPSIRHFVQEDEMSRNTGLSQSDVQGQANTDGATAAQNCATVAQNCATVAQDAKQTTHEDTLNL